MSSATIVTPRKSIAGRWAVIAVLAALLPTGGVSALGQDRLEVTSGESALTVKAAGRPVAEYQFIAQPRKPYLKGLFSPSGVNVLRDAPADHLHHHALMFAVAVDGVDFWSENEKCGRQKHVALSDRHSYLRDGVSWTAFTQEIDWIGPVSDEPLLKERRTIELCRIPDAEATVVTWRCRLEPPGKGKPVTLSGSPYFGLGMRFVESMDRGGHFRNADGKTGVEGTNDVRSRWCAYAAAADGKPVTVAMFGHPDNARHPATWFTMDSPFAYLAATLNLDDEPLTIRPEKPLELQYAVAVWDGRVEAERIEKLYRRLTQ